MPLQKWYKFEVIVICAKGIEEGFGHLDPADVEEELEEGEERYVEVDGVGVVVLLRVQELLPQQGEEEEGVHGYGHHLHQQGSSVIHQRTLIHTTEIRYL